MGRGKVELKRIEKAANRQVSFSKRRNGLLKKAFELSVLCDAELALLIFSPSGKAYQFASHDIQRTIGRYRSEVGLEQANGHAAFSNMEAWKNEIDELKRTVDKLETRQKHIGGDDLEVLGMKELKQLERQLRTGVERIRSKKHRALHEENLILQKKVKMHELMGLSDSNSRTLGIGSSVAYDRFGDVDGDEN